MNPVLIFSAHSVGWKRLVVLFASLIFLPTLNLQAEAPPTSVRIQNTGVDAEGMRTFRLEWNSVSNATYRVQKSGSLGPGALWKNLEAITPVGGTLQYEIKGRSIPENSIEFYRLVLPQPEIFSVEPAVMAPGVTVNISLRRERMCSNSSLQAWWCRPSM
ncbi:MAG: DUF1987 domain-containing protein [Verrucomicrobiota bacterium]|nr:DUF1987 domain-containing protein [Verrucomicrobiota bacterium]